MKRRPGALIALVVTLALLFQMLPNSPFALGQQVGTQEEEELKPLAVPGELIIRFKPGVSHEQIQAFYREYSLVEQDNLDPRTGDGSEILRVALSPADVSSSLVELLQRDPRVLYAEPNYILQVNASPNDPDFGQMWALNNTGQTGGTPGADIKATLGWDVTTGSDSVVVAVIDTGVDLTHPDIVDNLWVNPAECPGGIGNCQANGVDDDGNGYIDDFHGINAINDSGNPADDYGHGTHVAGIIGAAGNSGVGITGVAWDVELVICKFLGATGGGSVAAAVKCFNYVNDLKNNRDVNIVAANSSWGGSGFSQALYDAMAGPDQPLHICAAGNSNSSNLHYPAAFDLDNIIAVSSTDHNDQYSDFSNYGPWADLAAPGTDILSTVPSSGCPLCDPSGYALVSGTSMAAPHVSGAVALIKSEYPTLTSEQIKQRILSGIDPLGDTSKNTATNGRLNVYNTLENDTAAPAPVANLSIASLKLTQVDLTWTASGDDGKTGTANAYDIRYSKAPITEDNWASATQATGEPKPQPAGTAETFTVSGLEPNTTYYFAMKVLDNVGNESELSNTVIGKTSSGTVMFEDNFENGEGEWTATGTDDLWHISENRSNSPTHAWYYGDESSRTYDTGGANSGFLTSPEIVLESTFDVLLSYYEWSELEDSTTYDRTRLQVSTDGTSWETVFESHGTNDAWVQRLIPLTEYLDGGNTLRVRFWFDSIDNRFNNFEGWYIDDVRVLVATPSAPGEEAEPLPNLYIQPENIGFSTASPIEGDPVTAYAVVLNNGAGDANDVTVQFMDATGETPVPLGMPQTIANIPAGGSAVVQTNIQTAGKTGEQTLRVVLDPINLIAESNEADNSADQTLEISAPAAANLSVASANIGFNPSNPKPGDQVTINAVIFNDGAVEAADVLVHFLDVTDTGVATPVGAPQVIPSLPPGASASLQTTYDTTGKTTDRRIRVIVDPQNAIPESSETDNEATATITIAKPPQANLSLSTNSVGFSPPSPMYGQAVTVTATILNDGAVEATDVPVVFADATASSAVPIGEPQIIPSIPPGASASVSIVYETAGRPGDRKIRISVDPQNFIAETRETDNEVNVTLTVAMPPAPNLTMLNGNVAFSPARPVQGEDVVVHAVVLNTGNVDVEGVLVQFMNVTNGSPRPIGEQMIGVIPAGGSATAEVTVATEGAAGDQRIQVVLDPNNFVIESNEQDNETTQTLAITPSAAPNLTMLASNVTFTPPQPDEGETTRITAVVVNNGAAPAERVLVQFVDVTHGGALPIGAEQTIESIPPGGTASASVDYSTTGKPGNRKIQILVDSNNLIAETDENDNEAVVTLGVSPSAIANLVIHDSDIGTYPPNPVAGQAVSLTVTIHNQGDADANNVLVHLLDISDGEPRPFGEPLTIEHIPAGGAGIVHALYETDDEMEGERRIRVVVDPNNFIPELDETDNRASVGLLVSGAARPNIVVQNGNIGFIPSGPTTGDAVTVTATILNNGGADATDVLVQFVDATGGGAEPIGAKVTIPLIPAGGSGQAHAVYNTTGKSGERRIRVVADPHMVIQETRENDNEAIALLNVASAPLPNLVIRENNIGFNPRQPQHGTVVSVTATILNNGTAPASNVVVQVVDATSGAPIAISAGQVIEEIPAGGSGQVHISYNTLGRFGERKIQIIVDPNNQVPERDENDNRATGTLTVRTTPGPNLVVRANYIGFNPPTPAGDETVTVYATIRNDGGAPVGNVAVQFVDTTGGGSTLVGQATIEAIAAGGSALVQTAYDLAATGGVAAGDRKIQVVVDPNNAIAETSETDNNATATLALAKAPAANLAISPGNITFDNASPTAGDTVVINAVVLNTGAADVTDVVVQFTDVTDSSSKTPIGPQQVIPAIPAGGSSTVQVTYDTTGKSGDISIEVVVDPNNFIAESRETDNSARKTLEIVSTGMPNLLVLPSNITQVPLSPIQGDPVTIRVVVLNTGDVEARDVAVQFVDISGGGAAPIGLPQMIARIPAGSGGVAQVTYQTTDALGDREIQVTADPNNFIVEADENDNRATHTVAVGEPPAANLTVLAGNIAFDPAEPSDGDLVTIQATILNNGSDTATDVVVRFEDVTDAEPVLIGKQRLIDYITPGGNATAEVTYDVTDLAGDRTIQVSVDPNDTIPESDENDNVATATLTIAPPPAPNLLVQNSDIKFSPTAPTTGQVVTITATIRNDGDLAANKVEVQFVDASNGNGTPIGNIQTIAAIAPGSSGTASVTLDTTGMEGERTIRVVVDPNDLIDELNEGDNEAEAKITIAEPPDEPPTEPEPPSDEVNLAINSDSITFDPEAPEEGDTVTITVQVSNTGGASASNVVVRFNDTTDAEPVQIGEDQTISSISAGGSGTASVAYDTTGLEGPRTIQVVVDPDNAIEESDEDDNEATKTLGGEEDEPGEGEGDPGEGEGGEEGEPPGEGEGGGEGEAPGEGEGEGEEQAAANQTPRPNLAVADSELSAANLEPRAGDRVYVAAVIRNNGDADAYDIDILVREVTRDGAMQLGEPLRVDYIAAGSSAEIEILYDTSGRAGPATVEIALDPNDLIREASEIDNDASIEMLVRN